jgi:hypothetical protein
MVISGNPGTGKTRCAWHLVEKLGKTTPIIFIHPKEEKIN